ncbi:YlxR family protein [Mycoplasma sp. CSL10166]|uniref:YlxR family protein n=1 Tax=Mycoplasma sp. CSL10166 TaxID=2813825 RepID=UPI00197C1FE4|nr:YlxR family protein [Mycoplasma sp. CSL10166]MBN4084282.1 YlxR family protein [Mycoplasma sp. CSL10166]
MIEKKKKINHNFTRKCIITNQIVDIKNLIRFNYLKNNNHATLDLKRELNGRGAYFIPSEENWNKIKKTKALNRVFKSNISKENYFEIEQELKEVFLWLKKHKE